MPGIQDLLEKLLLDQPVRLGHLRLSLEYRNCGRCSRCAGGTARPHGPYIYARDKWGHRRYMGTIANPSPKLLAAAVDIVQIQNPDAPDP